MRSGKADAVSVDDPRAAYQHAAELTRRVLAVPKRVAAKPKPKRPRKRTS